MAENERDGQRSVAYFSMEIALAPGIPTYSGGLGVLAGDTVRSAADMGIPLVAVTLLSRLGYFHQHLGSGGEQTEDPVRWNPADHLHPMSHRVTVRIGGREVAVGCWRYDVTGVTGATVPVLLLDTALEENSKDDRSITDRLYGGDERYRLSQEVVLGVGGTRMLEAAGHTGLRRYHMNEGHASLLVLELLRREAEASGRKADDPGVVEAVRRKCVFTTHTPVEAGHDRFPLKLAREVIGEDLLAPHDAPTPDGGQGKLGELNMTYLGFKFSRYINGVAKRHGAFSRRLFKGYAINAITNGVHVGSWVSPPFARLFDRHIPDWRRDGYSLRSAAKIPLGEIREAHASAKRALIDHVNETTKLGLTEEALTIGFGRRATAYKRADLVFTDPARLRGIAKGAGPMQLIFGGKAHPRDEDGKTIIRRIFEAAEALGPDVRIAYLPNYEMPACGLMTAGCDLWLNTPRPPMEASGTSGMKAALNGVPSLSVLDGWWVEGCIEGVTGWAIGEDLFEESAEEPQPSEPAEAGRKTVAKESRERGERAAAVEADRLDAESLYTKLEGTIAPMFCEQPEEYAKVMRHAIAINGAFFHTQRMMSEYVAQGYFI